MEEKKQGAPVTGTPNNNTCKGTKKTATNQTVERLFSDVDAKIKVISEAFPTDTPTARITAESLVKKIEKCLGKSKTFTVAVEAAPTSTQALLAEDLDNVWGNFSTAIAKSGMSEYFDDPTASYPPPEWTVTMNNIGAIPRREITAIKAKSKNGKGFLASIFAAVAAGAQFGSMSSTKSGLRVLYLDTEQGDANVHAIGERISTLANWETSYTLQHYCACKISKIEQSKRWEFSTTLIETLHPDVVVLDGIADLITDFNDVEASKGAVTQVLKTARNFNTAIIAIIHTNKGKEDHGMKGHLGTLLEQKAFAVFEVEAKNGVFNVKSTESRHVPFPDFSFTVGAEGIPRPVEAPAPVECDPEKLQEVFGDGVLSQNEFASKYASLNRCDPASAVEVFQKAKKDGLLNMVKGKGWRLNTSTAS